MSFLLQPAFFGLPVPTPEYHPQDPRVRHCHAKPYLIRMPTRSPAAFAGALASPLEKCRNRPQCRKREERARFPPLAHESLVFLLRRLADGRAVRPPRVGRPP